MNRKRETQTQFFENRDELLPAQKAGAFQKKKKIITLTLVRTRNVALNRQIKSASPKGWQNLRKKGYKLHQTTTGQLKEKFAESRSVSSWKSHKSSLSLLPCTHASSRIFKRSWFTLTTLAKALRHKQQTQYTTTPPTSEQLCNTDRMPITMFCKDHLPVRDTCKVPLERRGKKPDSEFTSHHPIAPLRSTLEAAQLNVKKWVHGAKPQTNDCGLDTTRARKIQACFFLSFALGIATTHK